MTTLDTYEAKAAALRACLLESGHYASADEGQTWHVAPSGCRDWPTVQWTWGRLPTRAEWEAAVLASKLVLGHGEDVAPTGSYPTGRICWRCWCDFHHQSCSDPHACGEVAS